MKKLVIALDVLTLLLVAGSGVLYFYSLRKLGLVRWLNYHSQIVKDVVPVDMAKYVVLALGVALVAVLAYRLMKNPRRDGFHVAATVFAIAIVLLYAFVVFFVTRSVTKADVFMTLVGAMAVLVQVLALAVLQPRSSQ